MNYYVPAFFQEFWHSCYGASVKFGKIVWKGWYSVTLEVLDFQAKSEVVIGNIKNSYGKMIFNGEVF